MRIKLTDKDKAILQKSIQEIPPRDHLNSLMEECAELIQACSKRNRRKFELSNIEEEVADIMLHIAQLLETDFFNNKLFYSFFKSKLAQWNDELDARGKK